MEQFQRNLGKYVEVSKKLAELNKQAAELRDERNSIEMDLTANFNEQKDLPSLINLSKSGLVFTVKKPGEWKKGWTLSKKQLKEYVMEILPEHGEDLLREIEQRHEPKLQSFDYQFDLKPMRDEK